MVKSCLFLILICFAGSASAQSGMILGRVKNINGDAIEGVSVDLQETQFTTITNLAGDYKIRDIPAGTYSTSKGKFLPCSNYSNNNYRWPGVYYRSYSAT